MKKDYNKYIPFIVLSLLVTFTYAQSEVEGGNYPGSIQVNAGEDVTTGCGDSNDCVELMATFLETFETDTETYTVTEIPYDPPFAFDGLANSLNPDIDDAWSDVDEFPFDFCFFGNLEQEFQVGSNGVIRFDVDPTDIGAGSNAYNFDQDIPNNVQPALSEANVFTPVHDIDPSVSENEEIGYEILGTYPNRVLVVSYYEVPMFFTACNDLLATHMAVFYEFSNIIDIYIRDKPVCESWIDGVAAVGIQNNSGTIAYTPPGRNTLDSPWETYDEAWRFAPSGEKTYEFEWLDQNGNVIGNTATIEVCPEDNIETYTARVVYTNTCNGDEVIVEDEVNVFIGDEIELSLGEDRVICEENFEINLVATPDNLEELYSINYSWYLNGILLEDTSNILTINEPGTYTVKVAEDDIACKTIETVTIYNPFFNVSLNEDAKIEICDESSYELTAEIEGINPDDPEVQYLWNTGETTPSISATDSGEYIVEVSYQGCTHQDSVALKFQELPAVDLGDDFEKCDNPDDIAILNAEVSNSEGSLEYTWYGDGGIIENENTSTLAITEAGIYTVEVNEEGAEGFCVGTDDIQVSYYANRNCIIPEGISPNGDGLNESLDLTFLYDNPGIEKLSIFNRNGIKIYEEEDYTNQWSGQTDNDDLLLPVGTYYYVLILHDEPEKTGFIYVNY